MATFYAWLVSDSGGEDIAVLPIGGFPFCLISTDRPTVETFRGIVQETATARGDGFRLVTMEITGELERVTPAAEAEPRAGQSKKRTTAQEGEDG